MNYSLNTTGQEILTEIKSILISLAEIRKNRPKYVKVHEKMNDNFQSTQNPSEIAFWDSQFDSGLLLNAEGLACFLIPAFYFPDHIDALEILGHDQVKIEVERILEHCEKFGFTGDPYLKLQEYNPNGSEYEIIDTAAFVLTTLYYTSILLQERRLKCDLNLIRINDVIEKAVKFLFNAHTGEGWGWTTPGAANPNENPEILEELPHLYFSYSALATLYSLDFSKAPLLKYRNDWDEVQKNTLAWVTNKHLHELTSDELISIDDQKNLIGNVFALGILYNCDYAEIDEIGKIINIWQDQYTNDLKKKNFHRTLNYQFPGEFVKGERFIVDKFPDSTVLPVYLTMCMNGVNRNFYDFEMTSEMVIDLLGHLDKQKLRKDYFVNLYGEGGDNWVGKKNTSFSMTYTERTIELFCVLARNLRIGQKDDELYAKFTSGGDILIRLPRNSLLKKQDGITIKEMLNSEELSDDDIKEIVESLELEKESFGYEKVFRLQKLKLIILKAVDEKKGEESSAVIFDKHWSAIQNMGKQNIQKLLALIVEYIGVQDAKTIITRITENLAQKQIPNSSTSGRETE